MRWILGRGIWSAGVLVILRTVACLQQEHDLHRFWSLRNKAAPSSGLLETLPMLQYQEQRATTRAGRQLAGGRDRRVSKLWQLVGKAKMVAMPEDYVVNSRVVLRVMWTLSSS